MQEMPPTATPLRELAGLFLKLGTTAFGGPAAHIAMMEDEVVRRRGWLRREEFLDLVGVTNLIPGPNSTEMAIHVGHRRAGWKGLAVAGVCFIAPAMLMVWALAWAYVEYGSLPRVAGAFEWVKPVVLAVVAQALWRLSETAVKNLALGLLGMAAFFAAIAGVNELIVLAGAVIITATVFLVFRPRRVNERLPAWFIPPILSWPWIATVGATTSKAWPLFWFFIKVGSVLYGSGYVLLAFLQGELVERRGWLTQTQLLDAVAVGQFTPGPVFTTATFVGYLVGGSAGAGLATLGIFLPAFIFVALSVPLIRLLRGSPLVSAILDGVNVASLGLMAAVAVILGRTAVASGYGLGLFALALILLMWARVNSAWLMFAAATVGLMIGTR